MNIVTPHNPYYLLDQDGNQIRIKTYEIGSWDMDADTGKYVTIDVSDVSYIVNFTGLIIRDDGAKIYPIAGVYQGDSGGLVSCFISSVTGDQVYLVRALAGWFDSALFDDSLVNRGYISMFYVRS